jgi:hypothetical protein
MSMDGINGTIRLAGLTTTLSGNPATQPSIRRQQTITEGRRTFHLAYMNQQDS